MANLGWKPYAAGIIVVLPGTLTAQVNPFNLTADSSQPAEVVGGVSTIDSIMIKGPSAGLPLRFGGIVPGSEKVMLDGRDLRRGVDYSMDNEAGVIYLMVPQKYGQALTVLYRHDPKRVATDTAGNAFIAGGGTPFKFNLTSNGSLSMLMGLGLTERKPDGSVLQTNVFGWNNSLSFGQSQLTGVLLYGQRSQVDAKSAYEYQQDTTDPDQGDSQLTLQSLNTKLGSGSLQLDYQDISKNFTAFNQLRGAGYEQSVIDQLSKERGLTREGFALKDFALGSLSFSNSYKTVSDDKGGITWRDMGIAGGGLNFNWSQRKIDPHFARFQDLAEADRQQLLQEAGMGRETMNGSYASSLGKLGFKSLSIDDGKGSTIYQREFSFSSPRISVGYSIQDIDPKFNRFGNLADAEKGQWAKEGGWKRTFASVSGTFFGAGTPLSFAQSTIEAQEGGYSSTDLSLGNKTWSLEHLDRSSDSTFNGLANLKPEEIDGGIAAISKMYQPGGMPVRPEERGWFARGAGLSRVFDRVTLNLPSSMQFSASKLKLDGKDDGGQVDTFDFSSKWLNFSYRNQKLGDGFNELHNMLELERNRLGNLAGLDRTDMKADTTLNKAKLSFSQTQASQGDGEMSRQSLEVAAKGLQVDVNSRSVSSSFTNINQMLDPEQGLLPSLVGFKEHDTHVKWDLSPNLQLESFIFNGENPVLDQSKALENLLLAWQPSKGSRLEYLSKSDRLGSADDLLYACSIRRFSFASQLGRNGKLQLLNESVDYAGTQGTAPDSTKNFVSYETKLNPTTTLKTEQTRTSFDNGDKEDISTNTIATNLNKHAGVSVTDTAIDRRGDDKDQALRNIGFWVDLGGGIRFTYGLAQQQNTVGSSTSQAQMSVTPGTVGNLQIQGSAYSVNQWEQGDRTQAATNVSFATAKPVNFGLLKDIKFSFGMDTASDQRQWLKDNKVGSFSAKLAGNSIGFDYRSQVDPTGARGIDRTFRFQTDQSEKKPLRADVMYKMRTLPGDEQVMIRNYNLTARIAPGFELSNQVMTNPEVTRGDVILGSITQGSRVNRWKLDYKRDPNFLVGGTWDEMINEDLNAFSRTAGLNFTFFSAKGSPLTLFYGMEEVKGNVPHRLTQRYSIRFDQKPGPNQMFSIFAGNVSYDFNLADGAAKNNLTLQLEYQLKFWSGKGRKKQTKPEKSVDGKAPDEKKVG